MAEYKIVMRKALERLQAIITQTQETEEVDQGFVFRSMTAGMTMEEEDMMWAWFEPYTFYSTCDSPDKTFTRQELQRIFDDLNIGIFD